MYGMNPYQQPQQQAVLPPQSQGPSGIHEAHREQYRNYL